MAQIEIDALFWDSLNTRVRVYYNQGTDSTPRSISVGPRERIDPAFPAEPPGVEPPSQRTYQPGEVMAEFPEGTDKVTLTAQSLSPYASIAVSPNGTGENCDLFATVASASGSTIVFNVTTSHPPFSSSDDGVTFVENRTTFTSVVAGQSKQYYFADAQGCSAVRTAGINATTPPPGAPNGLLIDSFQEGGETISLYYLTSPTRAIQFYSPSGRVLVGPVDEATRQRTEDSLFGDGICEGTTQVKFRTTLIRPFAQIVDLADAAECTPVVAFALTSSTPFAPVPPATTGRWQVDTTGGLAPRMVSVPGYASGVLLSSEGYKELAGIPPGPHTATLTDSSSPPQVLTVGFTIPAYVPPAPTVPDALPEPPPQNLQTFPFTATGQPLLDAAPAACADQPFALRAPVSRFLPFSLRRLKAAGRWLDCAQVLDADTGEVLLTLNPRLLGYEKFTDATYDYFLSYGGPVTGLSLPLCRRLRLRVDEFTSVAFQAVSDLSEDLLVRWWHPGPLAHLPYGTGLEQHLYIPGATLREGAPREERTETKNALTASARVDFLAQARTVSFETEPFPAWLVQAVQGAKAHAVFAAPGFTGGEYPVQEVKATEFGALSCFRSLSVSLEYPPLVVVGCPPAAPLLSPLPASYPMSC
ncbi:hypothetical protein [Hymenobacter tenuis]